MTHPFPNRAAGQDGPATGGFAITPSDEIDLAVQTRALYAGASGDIAIVLASGDEVTLSGVLGGTLLPIRVARVKASGTSATALVGLV